MNQGLRIAIADDEPLLRRYFAEILPDLGHEVVAVAENGRQLVEQCYTAKPDLVISDIKMPEMDGIDAALQIAQNHAIPIILVSAYHDSDLISRAAQSRVMAYLVKPIQRADLEAAIEITRRRFAEIESSRQETEKLRAALEDRKIIERAKGLLMKTGLSEEDAFRRMQKIACDKNRKLVDVARLVLNAKDAIELLRADLH